MKYRIVILITLLIVITVIQNKNWKKEKDVSDLMVSNNVEFSGIITDVKVSGNHTFGIITVKINKANLKKFSPIIDGKNLFPYAIRDSIAEIYTTTSVLKKGDSVEINSNMREVKFSTTNGIMYTNEIHTITDKTNIEFVKEKSLILNY